MANWAEIALLCALSDVEAVESLAASGLSEECVPTPGLFAVYTWAIEAFMSSKRLQAPSRAALATVWGERLDAWGIELVDEDVQVDTVAMAVKHLKAQHARQGLQQILTTVATEQALAEEPDLPGVVAAAADRLADLAERVRERPSALDAACGIAASLDRAQHRLDNPDIRDAFGLGLGPVDRHTGGIQSGEIAALLALEKTGKTFAGLWSALSYFRAGGAVALFSLENTEDSAFDRLVCLANGVDYEKYQKGEITGELLEQLRDWHADHAKDLAARFAVLSPQEGGGRSAAAMCHQARMFGADAVVIDQLSHMTRASTTRYTADNSILAETMRELRSAVTAAAEPLKCLLLVQAKRDAAQTVAKTGSLGRHAAGGTSEIERGVDQLYGLHRTEDDEACEEAQLELLAFRRGRKEDWRLDWAPWRGFVRAQRGLHVAR